MADLTGRRPNWIIGSDGDWVERRHRHGSGSPNQQQQQQQQLPAAVAASGDLGGCGGGFVRRNFLDSRPQMMPPLHTTGTGAVPPPLDTSPLVQDGNDGRGGRWVAVVGVPTDACLEVREYLEASYGATTAFFVAPPAAAAIGGNNTLNNCGGGFGSGSAISGGGSGGRLQECYVRFEGAVHAERAVRAGELHFYVERGAACTVAEDRLARLFPDTAAAAAGLGGRSRQQQHRHSHQQRRCRDGMRADEHADNNIINGDGYNDAAAAANGDVNDDDDGISGRIWVAVSVHWCADQRILPMLSRPSALPTTTAAGGGTSPVRGRAAGHNDSSGNGMNHGDVSPDRRSETLTMDHTLNSNSTSINQQQFGAQWGLRPAPGGGGIGDSANSSVIGLYFASATRMSALVAVPRLVVLIVWTALNFLSSLFLGGRASGKSAPRPTATTATAAAAVVSPSLSPSSSLPPTSSSSSPSVSPALQASGSDELSRMLLASERRSQRRRRGGGDNHNSSNRTTVVLRRLTRALLRPSYSDDADAPSSSSLAPLRLLSSLFYAVFGAFAPAAADVDLLLWSWLTARNWQPMRNHGRLRQRLQRLARDFSYSSSPSFGEPVDKFSLAFGAEALGWDGAFADFRLFDDDLYSGGGGRNSTNSNSMRNGGEEDGRGRRGGGSAGREWASGPPPLRVLLTWRSSQWVTRYAVVSAAAVVGSALYLSWLHQQTELQQPQLL